MSTHNSPPRRERAAALLVEVLDRRALPGVAKRLPSVSTPRPPIVWLLLPPRRMLEGQAGTEGVVFFRDVVSSRRVFFGVAISDVSLGVKKLPSLSTQRPPPRRQKIALRCASFLVM